MVDPINSRTFVKGAAGVLPDFAGSAASTGLTLYHGESVPDQINQLAALLDNMSQTDLANGSSLVMAAQQEYINGGHYHEAGMGLAADAVTIANPLVGATVKGGMAINKYVNSEGPTNQERLADLYEFATQDPLTVTAEDVLAAIMNNPNMTEDDRNMISHLQDSPANKALDKYVEPYIVNLLPSEPLMEGQEPLSEGESYIAYITRGIRAGRIKAAEFVLDDPGSRDSLDISASRDEAVDTEQGIDVPGDELQVVDAGYEVDGSSEVKVPTLPVNAGQAMLNGKPVKTHR